MKNLLIILLLFPSFAFAQEKLHIKMRAYVVSPADMGYEKLPGDYTQVGGQGWWDKQCCLQQNSGRGLFSDACFAPDRLDRVLNTQMCEIL